jgi:hypothetical protein
VPRHIDQRETVVGERPMNIIVDAEHRVNIGRVRRRVAVVRQRKCHTLNDHVRRNRQAEILDENVTNDVAHRTSTTTCAVDCRYFTREVDRLNRTVASQCDATCDDRIVYGHVVAEMTLVIDDAVDDR